MHNWFVVDCEGKNSPMVSTLREFGVVNVANPKLEFYSKITGNPHQDQAMMLRLDGWLHELSNGARPIFWSDNPAFDWQWINGLFHVHLGRNPFGHSARRIGDLYAGVVGDIFDTSGWKKFRVTPHDHHPLNDARGNVEALRHIVGMMKKDVF